ncbi:hypothetical protein BJ684DRAFT_20591 [Piptocephalis cylindrospora]|uniref:HECT-type E3 ubiquitin transferase n=1 Tax=Piptocephalis cylindrospora TaxID=1907219 RepID=A0A4P9Y240_9FUNG|nr:hypothetical protein BJ684DRAFT_20591 [Piptocephalis cylindrospora]|eukprot:RKP12887.1 hypothetical protein BJ684DRAFT_20591 [Piptocephalis cylindrospora]
MPLPSSKSSSSDQPRSPSPTSRPSPTPATPETSSLHYRRRRLRSSSPDSPSLSQGSDSDRHRRLRRRLLTHPEPAMPRSTRNSQSEGGTRRTGQDDREPSSGSTTPTTTTASSSSSIPASLPSEFINFINAISAYEEDDTEIEFRNDMHDMSDSMEHIDDDDDDEHEELDEDDDEEDDEGNSEEYDEENGDEEQEGALGLDHPRSSSSATSPLQPYHIHLSSPRGRMMSGGSVSRNSPQFKAFLQQITSDDPTIQLLGLEQLAQDLIISQEDDLAGSLHPPSFIRALSPLISLNSYLFGSQVSLLASRCVAHLIEVLPAPTVSAIHADRSVIPGLCGHLREIVDMDVTEQALLTLSKLAHPCGAQIVRAGGLPIILAPLSFFEIRTQRTALSCIATCCAHLDPGMVEEVIQAVPVLRDLINSSPSPPSTDLQVLAHACTAWARIVERYASHPDILSRIIDSDILQSMIRLLSPIGSPHAPTILRFLTPLTSSSSECQKILRDPLNLELLAGWLDPPQGTTGIREVLNLLRHILPDHISFREYRKAQRKGGKGSASEETDADHSTQGETDNKEWLEAADKILIPVLIKAAQSPGSSGDRLTVQKSIVKCLLSLISHSEAPWLETHLSLIAGYAADVLFGPKDPGRTISVGGVQLVEWLVERGGIDAVTDLDRQGVLYAIDKLSQGDLDEEINDGDKDKGIEERKNETEDTTEEVEREGEVMEEEEGEREEETGGADDEDNSSESFTRVSDILRRLTSASAQEGDVTGEDFTRVMQGLLRSSHPSLFRSDDRQEGSSMDALVNPIGKDTREWLKQRSTLLSKNMHALLQGEEGEREKDSGAGERRLSEICQALREVNTASQDKSMGEKEREDRIHSLLTALVGHLTHQKRRISAFEVVHSGNEWKGATFPLLDLLHTIHEAMNRLGTGKEEDQVLPLHTGPTDQDESPSQGGRLNGIAEDGRQDSLFLGRKYVLRIVPAGKDSIPQWKASRSSVRMSLPQDEEGSGRKRNADERCMILDMSGLQTFREVERTVIHDLVEQRRRRSILSRIDFESDERDAYGLDDTEDEDDEDEGEDEDMMEEEEGEGAMTQDEEMIDVEGSSSDDAMDDEDQLGEDATRPEEDAEEEVEDNGVSEVDEDDEASSAFALDLAKGDIHIELVLSAEEKLSEVPIGMEDSVPPRWKLPSNGLTCIKESTNGGEMEGTESNGAVFSPGTFPPHHALPFI